MHSLVMNHPFVDGNKRAGAAAAELFLNVNGVDPHRPRTKSSSTSLSPSPAAR